MNKLLIIILTLLLSLETNGQRIVSLVPSVTQTLIQIGASEHIVGRTSYCPEVNGAEIVGDVMTVNVEKIVALKPDAVITMSFTKASVIRQLRMMGIYVMSLETPRNFEEICEQTREVAELANCETNAAKIITEETKRVAAATNSKKGKRVFFQIGTNPVWGAASNTYLSEMVEKLGMTNIVDQDNGSTSREYVIASKPDVIIMTTMGGLAEAEKKSWMSTTQAQTVTVDDNTASCPTPTNYRKTLESISVQLK